MTYPNFELPIQIVQRKSYFGIGTIVLKRFSYFNNMWPQSSADHLKRTAPYK